MALLKTALIYDFDGTLARGNMQEVTFIPSVGMGIGDFWGEADRLTREADGDNILMYMQLMLQRARENDAPITRAMLREHGHDVKLFDGLKTDLTGPGWFDRINAFGARYGLEIEHYIVSAGLEEMIEGCPIRDAFRHVFASHFVYDDKGVATWPAVGVNYTTKTQYLFRINKGVLNHYEHEAINRFMPDETRPVPFERMIFLGDGDTDVPTMKMMHTKGGFSIAVYDPRNSDRDQQKIYSLISEDRVNFVAAADYREGRPLDLIVKGLLGRIAITAGTMPEGV
ncbi:MAG: haloacid dehalogenase-like hydrolase [Alphaproteobacteria bacterium]|nr:haloacid dehalogenase-like hydrolase [Alphaproteobacteria bacterium]MBU1526822.1 haloacid dehalogenase-like hydrolase [Alphaproteobacteria bacterium]MBU2118230.1 haloacid dehalogenase-like hydrolase [Alphaproteobacteria bacterium]MBU2351657.1 haloacid dehalogenase-like hydrolase [Alphaproteobacteria bacterium]MBU2381326.1 haloacid dehalogenase-like hydrolase [Alphaproteobacteria bacterium]